MKPRLPRINVVGRWEPHGRPGRQGARSGAPNSVMPERDQRWAGRPARPAQSLDGPDAIGWRARARPSALDDGVALRQHGLERLDLGRWTSIVACCSWSDLDQRRDQARVPQRSGCGRDRRLSSRRRPRQHASTSWARKPISAGRRWQRLELWMSIEATPRRPASTASTSSLAEADWSDGRGCRDQHAVGVARRRSGCDPRPSRIAV